MKPKWVGPWRLARQRDGVRQWFRHYTIDDVEPTIEGFHCLRPFHVNEDDE